MKSTDGKSRLVTTFMMFFIMLAIGLGGLNLFSERITRPIYILINFIPAIVMVLLYLYAKNTRGTKIFVVILVIGFSLFMLLNASANFVYQLTTPSTTTDKYAKLLKKDGYPSQQALAHFPAKIPAEAYRTDFYELPEFMGTTMKVNLKLYLPPEQAAALYEQYEKESVYTQKGLKKGETVVQIEDGSFITLPNLGITITQEDLDDTYTLFLLGGAAKEYSCGVIINVEAGEVIYWGEKEGAPIQ